MYKLEYKAKIDDNCNKNIYITICVVFSCTEVVYVFNCHTKQEETSLYSRPWLLFTKSLTKNLKDNVHELWLQLKIRQMYDLHIKSQSFQLKNSAALKNAI